MVKVTHPSWVDKFGLRSENVEKEKKTEIVEESIRCPVFRSRLNQLSRGECRIHNPHQLSVIYTSLSMQECGNSGTIE